MCVCACVLVCLSSLSKISWLCGAMSGSSTLFPQSVSGFVAVPWLFLLVPLRSII